MQNSFAKMFWVSNKKLSFKAQADRKERRSDGSLVKFYYTTITTFLDIYTEADCVYGQNESPVSSIVQLLALCIDTGLQDA